MPAILEIRNLWKNYPGFSLKGINLDVQPGVIVGLLGRNGAGKSTLIKCALGLCPAESAVIKIAGRQFGYSSAGWRRAVGFVGESHPLYDWMRVREFLDFMSGFYPAWDKNYCAELIDRFKINPGKRIRDLSHGMRVKIALIAALAHHPPLLVLDEPTSGLDPVARADFLGELRDEVARDSGKRAVLISSHVLEDITAIADEIAILREGELVMHAGLAGIREQWKILCFETPKDRNAGPLNGERIIRVRDGFAGLVCRLEELPSSERQLAEAGILLEEVRVPTLQELFLSLA